MRRPALTAAEADQLVLRGLIFAGPLIAVLASGIDGPLPPWWLVAIVALLGFGFAWAPESASGTFALVAVLGWWGLGASERVLGGVLVAAVAMVVAHLAGLVAAYGSKDVSIEPSVVWTWMIRGGRMLLVVPVVWVAAVALQGQPEPPGVWLLGGLAALMAIVASTSGFDLYQGRRIE